MEWINDYIYIQIEKNNLIEDSYCQSTKDDDYIHLNFGLFAKDCLFDLDENNYLIQIRIAKSYFDKYGEQLYIHIEKQSICCNTQSKLLELINCNLEGLQRKIVIESNILYLLFQSQKNSLIFQTGCNTCAVLSKPIDSEKMQLAKLFILDNLANNLTIPIIAGHVGTNQCYIKKGFKEVFNQTIFEFIQENRMLKARHLLQHTNQNVTEIAFSVGYASLSSFSQAYKNYFGISPMEQAKASISNN